MDEKLVKVWITTLKDGRMVRVATIEQNGRKESSCEGCSAPCCRGSLLPVLNEDELRNKKFPIRFVAAPAWLQKQVPRAQYIAVLRIEEGGCGFFNSILHRCRIYPNCPASCLSYDCKGDERMIEIWRNGELSRTVEMGSIESFVPVKDEEKWPGR